MTAELQLCGPNAEGTPAFSFASCVASLVGLPAAAASRVAVSNISDTTSSACGSAGANSACCCDTAALVQFAVTAVDSNQAAAFAGVMSQGLTGPAMVQCLQVSMMNSCMLN